MAASEEDELESLELDELLEDDFVCTAFGAAGRLADLALGAALAAGRPGRPFAFALAFALGRATKISEMCGTVPSEHCDTSDPSGFFKIFFAQRKLSKRVIFISENA